MSRMPYPTDLTDEQWDIIKTLMPEPRLRGRRIEADLREVVNAIFSINRAGCQWGMLPHDFPSYKTVNWYYNLWRREGLWDEMLNALRDVVRESADLGLIRAWPASTVRLSRQPTRGKGQLR